ncbi:MAG: cobaltochelatase subunit CobN [Actinomycetia bacterium]|nr:cobaltochelatase subunit CobN [Actinomycetes bacterium]
MFKTVFIINYDGKELFFRQAFAELQESLGNLIAAEFFDTSEIDDNQDVCTACLKALETADFVYLYSQGGLPYFKRFNFLQKAFLGKTPSFINTGIDDENNEMRQRSALSPVIHDKLMPYHLMGGSDNLKGFLSVVFADLGGLDCPLPELVVPKWEGLYGLPEGVSEAEYLDSIAVQTDKPVIGIIVHRYQLEHDNMRHVEALIEAISDQGGVPLVMYSNIAPLANETSGLAGALKRYMLRDGKPLVDAVIVTSGFSLSILAAPGDGSTKVEQSIFEALDVPVLQAMFTYFSYEQWHDALAGVDSILLGCNVFQPEFDGQVITVAIGYSEAVQTKYGTKYEIWPIADRVQRVVRIALRWAKLRKTAISDKKVAIVLHNMPPRADMIGCAYGLDTPESVFNVFKMLQGKGLTLEYAFAEGQEIIKKITDGVTNDGRFLSEAEMLERSTAAVAPDAWRRFFAELPPKSQSELERDWGEMPGEFMVVDEQILVPGIINGNLFIGLQPPRALEEQAEEAYHSTDIVCPWQYLAFYRYLDQVFAADVVIHMGTHGTIEWLPGKEVALSQECYPDIAIGEMPHIYPYIIDVPGEGAQAKRRTDAVIIDHLIPSMTESGSYGELAGVEEQIAQYQQAALADPGKCSVIAEQVWAMAAECDLHCDLGLSAEQFFADPEAAIEQMHLWISEIKSSKIKDGLHIFGAVPCGQRYLNLLRLLVNVRNGDVPSIREGVAALRGYDLEDLLCHPDRRAADGQSNAMLLEELDELGRQAFTAFAEVGLDAEAAKAVAESLAFGGGPDGTDSGPVSGNGTDGAAAGQGDITSVVGGEPSALAPNLQPLIDCLRFVATELQPRLDRTTDELLYLERGIDGRFVPPGPSGAPSRGNATILPTGRNFYMVDPTMIPSRSSWQTGRMLADQLIWRYQQDEGAFPESVAIVVYSGETIKTNGDDIAEIMYLYGVRPVWLGNTNRVIDIEVIPLEELGRPRIDVTLRISGLFRDTFPNLIERIEDAVNLVAALDEDEAQNFVKKHVMADFRDFIAAGMQHEQAFEYSRYRVFSDPPGTYGAGVDTLIYSKQWQTDADLGQAYINWGAYAYGKKVQGAKLEEVFSRRLATCDATVKNVSSVESDMLDSDDFFNYHGGLISAVKTKRGSLPMSFATNAGDPEHVKTKTIHEETSRVMRARINNPQWIEGLKQHGFRGAQEFSAMVDIVFGWDATSSVVDDWMYDSITQTYLLDDELQEWIRENNPWALQAISERLLEAAQRGMWDADEEMLEQIRQIYLSVEGDLEDS